MHNWKVYFKLTVETVFNWIRTCYKFDFFKFVKIREVILFIIINNLCMETGSESHMLLKIFKPCLNSHILTKRIVFKTIFLSKNNSIKYCSLSTLDCFWAIEFKTFSPKIFSNCFHKQMNLPLYEENELLTELSIRN